MVLSHHKASILASIFHAIFMIFPNHLPEAIFRGSKCPSMLVSEIFSGFRAPAGSKNYPLEQNFPPNTAPKVTWPSSRTRPGADLGAIWCRIRSKDAFSSIWGRFLIDFGRIFEQFSEHVECYFSKFQRRINTNSLTCVRKIPHHETCKSTMKQSSKPQPHKPTNLFPGVQKSTP